MGSSPPLALIFVLLLFPSSAPSRARSASVVTRLPGFRGPLPFYMETGYVEVDEVNEAELFYYFIESERNPIEDPLLLWLTGGPRCSAFCGLVFEVGPLKFVSAKYNGSLPSLVYRPYSWTKVSNMIFLDSPAGSGFSFSRHAEGYDAGDRSWSKHAHTFLLKWFIDHPKFLSNPLYIAGDSYAGKIVPIVTQEVLNGIEAGKQPPLNLQGYIIGNPITGERADLNSRVPFAHSMGIISDDFFELTQRSCEGQDYRSPTDAKCEMCLNTFDEFLSEINLGYMLDPKCARTSPKPKTPDRRTLQEEYLYLLKPPPIPALYCRNYAHFLSYHWANTDIVRKAIHVKKGTVGEWQRCNYDLPYTEDINSSIMYHLRVTSKRYRALVYSGDHDMLITFVGTNEWIRSLNFSIVDDWRSWHVGGQVAGYTTSYSNNLTFATVKGAGHTAAEYKEKECFAMIRRWLSHKPL
ncbi:hypothetical protein C4D60_Mb04t01290 [Musa balbisiana]|uniref:Serine carboxypeptidase-like 18 n=1 Tax=Musa balbisiana TaxID=52838 RepID=A0A4S8K8V1_MUSBA|nr:hypothetical protein C4D60_Mb04t01290 [Musa balbisiana]